MNEPSSTTNTPSSPGTAPKKLPALFMHPASIARASANDAHHFATSKALRWRRSESVFALMSWVRMESQFKFPWAGGSWAGGFWA